MIVSRALFIAAFSGIFWAALIGGCAARGGRDLGDDSRPASYVVRPDDTLYSIAWRHDLDYRDLALWNDIGSDYRVSIGQVLALRPRALAAGTPPPAAGRPPVASVAPRVSKPRPIDAPSAMQGGSTTAAPHTVSGAAASPAPAAVVPSASAVPAAGVPAGGATKWVWPTDRTAPPRPVPGGGILVLGRLGQDVRAASSGRVVYTGSGLRGYGNLVILKHGESVLSSYAHNRELIVREGQEVAAGEVIAHMGLGPHQVSALYFEIRFNGKPTDPLKYLPPIGSR